MPGLLGRREHIGCRKSTYWFAAYKADKKNGCSDGKAGQGTNSGPMPICISEQWVGAEVHGFAVT